MKEVSLLSSAYGRRFMNEQRKVELPGSPQRCLRRFLIKDGTEVFIAEQIRSSQVERRQEIGNILSSLQQQGLPQVVSYLETKNGNLVASIGSQFWQVAPFIDNSPLIRPHYVFDAWRGELLAEFLLQLAAADIPPLKKDQFSLRSYIFSLLETLEHRRPELSQQVLPFFTMIDDFLLKSEKEVCFFSHGDFHPLNVLWAPNKIVGVIDWEFCGYKCVLYDVANLVGCIGIEHPDFLEEALLNAFFSRLGQAEFVQKQYIYQLPFLVIAVRFAWLSEWLRAEDEDMIRLEIDYMDFLCGQRQRLGEQWSMFF